MNKDTEKKIYKIWDTINGCFVQGNKKTHWNSLGWVTSKIESVCDPRRSYGRNRKPDEFEVREYKLVLENTMDAGDLFREKEEIERIRKEGARKYGEAAENIRLILPGLQVSTVKELYKKGHLSNDMIQELEPHIQVLTDNYKYTRK